MELTAIIPARKENGNLVDKNILPFGNTNLLIHKLRQLKNVAQIHKIIVSSEDDAILELAEMEGVIPLKRPEEYARSDCSFGKFVSYICSEVTGDNILWTCVTSPFIDEDIYRNAIKTYFEKLEEGYDSLITVQEQKRFMLDENGALNFKRGLKHPYSDQLPKLFLYSNGIAIAQRLKMIEWNYNWGHIPYLYTVDKIAGIEIHDKYDYQYANYFIREYRKNGKY